METVDELVKRADKRPGYAIVNYREVALPIFRVQPLLTLQVQREIGPIEEFVLRAIRANVGPADEIAYFLGLPVVVVNKQIGDLLYEDVIERAGGGAERTFQLTVKGRQRIGDIVKSNIERGVFPFYVDGLTRDVIPIDNSKLYANREIQEMGIEPLPPIPRRPPRGDELRLQQINRVLQVRARGDSKGKRVISVDAMANKTRVLFRPAVALAFKSESGRDISIGFMIDGVVSRQHEDMYMHSEESSRSTIFREMFDSKHRRDNIRLAKKELENDAPSVFGAAVSEGGPGDRAKLTLNGPADPIARNIVPRVVKPLSVYDHPPLLEQAVGSAQHRVLIISPWIRANVVNEQFLQGLESALQRGVEVTIGFGLGREDKGAGSRDIGAIGRLRDLAERYANFGLYRRGNTHAKVLIKDSEFFVTTSFNWLSFRGDPRQPFREEEGTYVGGEEIVDAYYERLIRRIRR